MFLFQTYPEPHPLSSLHKRSLQPATVLKETLHHGCFSLFKNCTDGTKFHKASHIEKHILALSFHKLSTETLKASTEILR